MVSRIKNINPPTALLASKWDELKADLLKEKNSHEAKTACYRDCTIEELTQLYKDKCAICERDRGIELQVDHYRPKKARANKTHTSYNHPGYYWLAYTWTNLLPLCSACNGKKSNKFPVKPTGIRVIDVLNSQGFHPFEPYDILWLKQTELPLLLNPETDNNLTLNFICDRSGKIRGRTDEGIETIKVYKLNRRELVRKRISIRQKIVNEIILSFDRFLKHKNNYQLKGSLEVVFDRIVQGTHQDHELSMYYTFLFKYFDYFIGTKVPATIRAKAVDYFDEYKVENNIN